MINVRRELREEWYKFQNEGFLCVISTHPNRCHKFLQKVAEDCKSFGLEVEYNPIRCSLKINKGTLRVVSAHKIMGQLGGVEITTCIIDRAFNYHEGDRLLTQEDAQRVVAYSLSRCRSKIGDLHSKLIVV